MLGESSVASRFEVTAAGGLTPIVGREEEIALLANRWRQASGGEGQVVVLSGEARVGKSRIVEGFRQSLEGEEFGTVMLSCARFRTGSALYPVIECLGRVTGFEAGDSALVKADKLEDFIRALDLDPAQIVPHLWTYIFEAGDARYPAPEGNPEELRHQTLQCLLSMLFAQSSRRPMMMIAEDVHWVDPSTLEFLGLMVDHLRDRRVMLLITARPEFDAPWGGHSQVGTVILNRLGKSDCASMVQRVAGGQPLPDEIMEQIIVKTDGVPLFAEELTKMVLEFGLVVEKDGEYELSGPLTSLTIPASLQDSLMARLDRLNTVKEVVQTASVIGRAFSEELLAAVSPLTRNQLRQALDRLVEVELIIRLGTAPATRYEFKHGLVQEAAYESMLISTRQTWHGPSVKYWKRISPRRSTMSRNFLPTISAKRAGRGKVPPIGKRQPSAPPGAGPAPKRSVISAWVWSRLPPCQMTRNARSVKSPCSSIWWRGSRTPWTPPCWPNAKATGGPKWLQGEAAPAGSCSIWPIMGGQAANRPGAGTFRTVGRQAFRASLSCHPGQYLGARGRRG